jgi:hypothetical protein
MLQFQKTLKNAMDRIDTNTIRAHIAYLADDKLKGRLPWNRRLSNGS